jgi:flagellar basal body-associated protein FliL
MSEPVNQVITYDEMGNAKTIPRNNELIISNDNTSSNYTLKQQETVILNKDENETKSQVKENCLKRFKNKNKKCFIFICIVISLVILIILTCLIYYIVINNSKDDGSGSGDDGDKKGIYASDGEKLVAKIKREKHQCCIVNETISIKLKQVDNDNISTEKTEKPLYHKYLLNIYDEEKIKDKPIKYYAYVLLLKQLEGNLPDIIAGNNIFDSIETENARNLKKEL